MRSQRNCFFAQDRQVGASYTFSQMVHVEYGLCERQLWDFSRQLAAWREPLIVWLLIMIVHIQKSTIRIQAFFPKVQFLLEQVDVI